MGSGASTINLTSEEVEDIQFGTHFKNGDIKRLYERFQALDRSKSGYISAAEFRLIPELSMNPVCDRIIATFDRDGSDRVNFNDFVKVLAKLHPQASISVKRELAFECYDVDGDGVISHSDLFHIMKLLVGSYIDDDKLNIIVSSILSKHKNGIDLSTFDLIVSDEDILSLMNIEF